MRCRAARDALVLVETSLLTANDPAQLALARSPLVPHEQTVVELAAARADLHDGALQVQLTVLLAKALLWLGRPDDALRELEAAPEPSEDDQRVKIAILRSTIELHCGRIDAAVETARAALRVAGAASSHVRAELLMHLGGAIQSSGAEDGLAESRALTGEALALARAAGQRSFERIALTNLGNRWYVEDSAHATALWERALALARTEGVVAGQLTLLGNLASCALHSDHARARVLAEEVEALARAAGNRVHLGRALAQAAKVHFEVGGLARALPVSDEAVAVLTETRNRLALPHALCARGLIEVRSGRDGPRGCIAREAAGTDPALVADIEPLEAILRSPG